MATLKLQSMGVSYLDTEIDVILLAMQGSGNSVFLRSIIQLTFVFSSFDRSNINGHTVGFHIAHQSTAPLIGYLFLPNHVTLHCFVRYRFLENDDATLIIYKENDCKWNFKCLGINMEFLPGSYETELKS